MFLILAALVVIAIPILLAFNALGGPHGGRRQNVAAADPRLAAAAMVYAVAREEGALDRARIDALIGLLGERLRLTEKEARVIFFQGQRLAAKTSGSLNSRLHQLRLPIEGRCSKEERRDVVEMLREAAGPSLERTPSIREAVGRVAASLLHS